MHKKWADLFIHNGLLRYSYNTISPARTLSCSAWQPSPLNPFPFPEQMGADEELLLEKIIFGDIKSSRLSNAYGIVQTGGAL